MAWRAAIAVAFVAGEVLLLLATGGIEEEPWATVLLVAVPLVVGLLIGRWWAVALSLISGPLYLIDFHSREPGGDELAAWFVIALFTAINAAPLALGVGTNRFARWILEQRSRPNDG